MSGKRKVFGGLLLVLGVGALGFAILLLTQIGEAQQQLNSPELQFQLVFASDEDRAAAQMMAQAVDWTQSTGIPLLIGAGIVFLLGGVIVLLTGRPRPVAVASAPEAWPAAPVTPERHDHEPGPAPQMVSQMAGERGHPVRAPAVSAEPERPPEPEIAPPSAPLPAAEPVPALMPTAAPLAQPATHHSPGGLDDEAQNEPLESDTQAEVTGQRVKLAHAIGVSALVLVAGSLALVDLNRERPTAVPDYDYNETGDYAPPGQHQPDRRYQAPAAGVRTLQMAAIDGEFVAVAGQTRFESGPHSDDIYRGNDDEYGAWLADDGNLDTSWCFSAEQHNPLMEVFNLEGDGPATRSTIESIAILPGPGRLPAEVIVRPGDGYPDYRLRLSDRADWQGARFDPPIRTSHVSLIVGSLHSDESGSRRGCVAEVVFENSGDIGTGGRPMTMQELMEQSGRQLEGERIVEPTPIHRATVTPPTARPAAAPRASVQLSPVGFNASSELAHRENRYRAAAAFDGDNDTAWGDGVDGPGRGEWIEADLGRLLELDRVEFSAGFTAHSERYGDLFLANAHARHVQVAVDGVERADLWLGRNERQGTLSGLGTGRRVRLRFDEVWPGERWDDLHISEIRIYGTEPSEGAAAAPQGANAGLSRTARPSRRLTPVGYDASSELADRRDRYAAASAFDGDSSTAWGDGVEGPGAGEWIEADLGQRYAIDRLELSTGFDAQSERFGDLFLLNAHVRRLRVEVDGVVRADRAIGRDERRVTVSGLGSGRRIRLRFVEVWPGERWDDLHVSEVAVFGRQ